MGRTSTVDSAKFNSFVDMLGELRQRAKPSTPAAQLAREAHTQQLQQQQQQQQQQAEVETAAREVSAAAQECPSFAELRSNPCWPQMLSAFECHAASTADAKGDECRVAFKAVHSCMLGNLQHFRSTVQTDEDLDLLKDFRGRVF